MKRITIFSIFFLCVLVGIGQEMKHVFDIKTGLGNTSVENEQFTGLKHSGQQLQYQLQYGFGREQGLKHQVSFRMLNGEISYLFDDPTATLPESVLKANLYELEYRLMKNIQRGKTTSLFVGAALYLGVREHISQYHSDALFFPNESDLTPYNSYAAVVAVNQDIGERLRFHAVAKYALFSMVFDKSYQIYSRPSEEESVVQFYGPSYVDFRFSMGGCWDLMNWLAFTVDYDWRYINYDTAKIHTYREWNQIFSLGLQLQL
ncbi:hypothetical protein K4L44_10090 [Halosquirtibacter laminarini]|uniref:Uncharacterized protein n=1 Tax=Halosquirtibacter laminarini TaxID=3374600 RepID=A0AC61NBV0_9BACT|nr:hypothetical protein K4L44_10090 [Prolixibacteraceae bacterium]